METDTLTAPDDEETALRELGHQTDMNEGRPLPEPTAAEPPEPRAPEVEEQPQPEPVEQAPPETELPQQEPQQQGRPRDPATGQFQKPAAPAKPETPYSKAVKDRERQDRSWQALQAEKEQFRMMQTQWQEEQRVKQLEAARANYAPLKKEGLTAQEYAEGARRFEADGDYENAYKAHQVAIQLGRAEQQRATQMQAVEHEYAWRMGMQEATKSFPQIWDPKHPIVGHLERIIGENPWIYYVPQGFQRAVEIADMLTQKSAYSELQDEAIKLRAELERYQRKSQPARGGVAAPRVGDKDFDDMSLDEQEAELRRMTAEADNYR